jgi:hypothetical protein
MIGSANERGAPKASREGGELLLSITFDLLGLTATEMDAEWRAAQQEGDREGVDAPACQSTIVRYVKACAAGVP